MDEFKKEKPLYWKIYEKLKKDIEEGKIKKGELISPEIQLTKIFNVSRITIRKALQLLQNENFIKRKKRFGTEVIYEPKKLRDKKAIGVLLVDITRPFFNEILKGIQYCLDKNGYKLVLCDTENKNEKEKEYILRYKDAVGGFIIAPCTENKNLPIYAELIVEKVPFVFIDRYIPELNTDYVVSDNFEGGYIITKHLIELGHKNIAVIAEPEATSVNERIEGYKKALQEINIKKEYIFSSGKRGFENGYETGKKIIKDFPEITAVFCINDDVAIGCLKAIIECGLKVPDDISIAGYDNLPFSYQIHPGLTTIEQEKFEMGKKAAEILLNRIEKGIDKNRYKVELPVNFIKRNSTSFPKKNIYEKK